MFLAHAVRLTLYSHSPKKLLNIHIPGEEGREVGEGSPWCSAVHGRGREHKVPWGHGRDLGEGGGAPGVFERIKVVQGSFIIKEEGELQKVKATRSHASKNLLYFYISTTRAQHDLINIF